MADKAEFNPGGPQATGGFAAWWNAWFSARSADITSDAARKTEDVIRRTGQKVVRWAAGTVVGGQSVGGRFATAKGLQFGYIDANQVKWRRNVQKELDAFYGTDGDWDE